jgi:hypothetical protein
MKTRNPLEKNHNAKTNKRVHKKNLDEKRKKLLKRNQTPAYLPQKTNSALSLRHPEAPCFHQRGGGSRAKR